MNTSKLLLPVLLVAAVLVSAPAVKACVDNTPSVTVTVQIDTVNAEMVMVLSNLALTSVAPNIGTFCTCALSTFSDVFSELQYVAFVDSGTTDVYLGFSAWTPEAAASGSWNDSFPMPGAPWQGFIAEVLYAGLEPTSPVELLIRAGVPPGYTVTTFDSVLTLTTLGTDEWDEVDLTVANHHVNLVNFTSGGPPTYVFVDTSYLPGLDALITEELVEVEITTTTEAAEISWELLTPMGGVVAHRECGYYSDGMTESVVICLPDSIFFFRAFDDIGDGWSGGTYEIVRVHDGAILGAGSPGPSPTGDGIADCADIHAAGTAGITLGCNSDIPPNAIGEQFMTDGVELQWGTVAESVACRLYAERQFPNPSILRKKVVLGEEPDRLLVPYGNLGAGSTWRWIVGCACELSPLDRTPYSDFREFSVPTPRLTSGPSWTMAPNPAAGAVLLHLPGEAGTSTLVTVADALGRIVHAERDAAGVLRLDVSAWTEGVYWVRVEGEAESSTRPLVVN